MRFLRLCSRHVPILVSALCVLASTAANAQWLSKVIPIPDTLYGLEGPNRFTCNARLGKLYVTGGLAGRNDALVINLPARKKTAVVRLPQGVADACVSVQCDRLFCAAGKVFVVSCSTDLVCDSLVTPSGTGDLEYCGLHDKVYANGFADSLAVLDPRTGARMKTVPLPGTPHSFLYCEEMDRLFCATRLSESLFQVTAVDCRTDSVVAAIPVHPCGGEVVYDPVTNRLFLTSYSGWSGIVVIDCAADTLVGYVPAGDQTSSLAIAPDLGRVFCANLGSDDIRVIDAASAAVVDTILIGADPYALHYCRALNRLYASSYSQDSIYSIDPVTDSVVGAVHTGGRPEAICAPDSGPDVYVANYTDGTVTVLDGLTLQVRNVITVDKFWPAGVCVDSVLNRAFCISDGGGDALVTVVDCNADSIVMNTFVPGRAVSIGCCPSLDKVYCCTQNPNFVTILRASTGQEISALEVGTGYPLKPVHAWNDGKVYVATNYGRLTAIDCETDSVVADFEVGGQTSAVCYNPAGHKLYIADETGSMLYVLDCRTDSVVDTVVRLVGPCALCYEPTANKLYCANGQGWTISVIDCYRDTIMKTFRSGTRPQAFSLNPTAGKLYCANLGVYPDYDTTVSVIDVGQDSIVRTLGVGTEPGSAMCYNPTSNKVFVSTGHWGAISASVIDCRDDRVVLRMPVPGNFWEFQVLPGLNKVYVPGSNSSVLSVISDSVYTGIGEGPGQVNARTQAASVLRGVLRLPLSPSPNHVSLFDKTGRRLMVLAPGPNDVSHLAPGVYFVREQSEEGRGKPGVRKVVITK